MAYDPDKTPTDFTQSRDWHIRRERFLVALAELSHNFGVRVVGSVVNDRLPPRATYQAGRSTESAELEVCLP